MTPEQSIADIDALVQVHHGLYMILFNIIIRHDDHLRLAVAETIRKILVAPIEDPHLSPHLRLQLQSLRDSLLRPPSPDFVEVFRQSTIRPVE
ncbi:MAG: hypothetical protein ACREX3_01380 [Gammaproteobacteria bacterium]